jgi:zinc D-Ala-D-Ala dipeptidase
VAGRRPVAPLVALLVVAAMAGCTTTSDGRGSAGPTTPSASPAAPSTTSASPAQPSASSSSPRAVRTIPPVSAQARAAGLLDIRTLVPDAIVDMRYATSDNFVGVPLYPPSARCLVHESMAPGLAAAARRLRREGDVLVFWDCYRPHAVQVRMFQIVPDPNWVARPGPYATSHEAARSVDVTLAQIATGVTCASAQRVQHHCLLDMGTDFDDFTPRAYAFATAGVSQQQQANRARLRTAMNSGGLAGYSGEWWHFDGPGADVERPILDVPVN